MVVVCDMCIYWTQGAVGVWGGRGDPGPPGERVSVCVCDHTLCDELLLSSTGYQGSNWTARSTRITWPCGILYIFASRVISLSPISIPGTKRCAWHNWPTWQRRFERNPWPCWHPWISRRTGKTGMQLCAMQC